MNISALHPYLKTKTEANKLISVLNLIADELFKENFNLSNLLSENVSYDLKTILENIFSGEKTSETNKPELKKFLISLQKEVNTLPLIHIILATPTKEKTIKTIHDWFYQNFNKIVLLDISVEEELIAGSIISFAGRAQDYSLDSKIGQMI